MNKYDPLNRYLEELGQPSIKLRFREIERIIGDTLPASASKYQAWWANEEAGTHQHARSWLDAGYRTRGLDLNARTVEFSRTKVGV